MFIYIIFRGRPQGVPVNVQDSEVVVSKSELQLRYYVKIRTNILGKVIELPYSNTYWLNRITSVLPAWLCKGLRYD